MRRNILVLFSLSFAAILLMIIVANEYLQDKWARIQSLSQELEEEHKLFTLLVLSTLFDGACLIIWTVAQWVVAQIVNDIPLSGIDPCVLLAIQQLLAITTLTPIIAHVSLTVVRAFVQTRDAIRKELKQHHC
ncbi:MAG: hypothetical protein ACPGWR_04130 [Ardenticatenaceae bacterium]